MVRRFVIMLLAGVMACLCQAIPAATESPKESPPALMGQVTSDAEGPMEGVVVSAKRMGSIVTVSVTSDEKGAYRFPADRLEPGQYSIAIRAVGYDLQGPATTRIVAAKATTTDLRLKKTADLAAQLTNAEWIESSPGTAEQKLLSLGCIECHTFERVARSTHKSDEWTYVIKRMSQYTYMSFPLKPQLHMDPNHSKDPETYRLLADYLATVNLSSGSTWQYPLKTWPRPKGRDTHVIVTEYDLPRAEIQAHDVIVDKDGIVWYLDFGSLNLGRFDPKTLKLTEYPIKENKPGYPVGELDLEPDPVDGTLWFDMMFQTAIGNFDPKTAKFKYYSLPKGQDSPAAQINFLGLHHEVDNKVWTKNVGNMHVYRIDLTTGQWEDFNPTKNLLGKMGFYQVLADSQNNLWIADMGGGHIVEIEGMTGETKWFTPPTPNSGPRRMNIDDLGNLYFAEYYGNNIGRLDTRSGKFTEWPLPAATHPYRVSLDKNGEIWTGGMSTDRVVRFNPKTNESIEYLMPFATNMRSSFVDNSTATPTFWVGSNHGAAIVKVEPLD